MFRVYLGGLGFIQGFVRVCVRVGLGFTDSWFGVSLGLR